jgi:hypothetical protein
MSYDLILFVEIISKNILDLGKNILQIKLTHAMIHE